MLSPAGSVVILHLIFFSFFFFFFKLFFKVTSSRWMYFKYVYLMGFCAFWTGQLVERERE